MQRWFAVFDRIIRATSEGIKADQTLILYTADHSYDFTVHGGRKNQPLLSESEKMIVTKGQDSIRMQNVRRDDDHAGEEVLVAAQGPGAERVRGILSNTELFRIMMAAFGWHGLN
jgi:alkaline phosphatase